MKLLLLGAAGYPILELLCRGRTHYSMSIAGGVSAWLIGRVCRIRTGFLRRCILGGLAVTGIEYLCGNIWNRHYRIWDYRKIPLNLHGQICLPFTLLWCGLSGLLMGGMEMMHHRHSNKPGS